MQAPQRQAGFTIIELMATVAIAAILTALALPAYTAYVQRSKVPPALDALSAFATRMEQRYQDTGSYGTTGCGLAPSSIDNFDLSCSLTVTNGVQGYTATATGKNAMVGYTYTINQAGARATTAHPKGANTNCWTMRGTTCDT